MTAGSGGGVAGPAPIASPGQIPHDDQTYAGIVDNPYQANDDIEMRLRDGDPVAPLPRSADGGYIQPDGHVVYDRSYARSGSGSSAASQDQVDAGNGALGNGSANGRSLGTFMARFDTRIPIFGPTGKTKPDGSPATYSFDHATGKAYWDFGVPNTVSEIPMAYKRPTIDELTLDPSNVWTQGPRLSNVLIEGETLSLALTAGIFTGGAAFTAARAAGAGFFTAGAVSGGVADLTLQGANNLEYWATGGADGHSGINLYELGGSMLLGGVLAKGGSIAMDAWQSYRSGASAAGSTADAGAAGSAEVPIGTAARPTVQWASNAGGVVRTPDEMMALAKQAGVTFPEDVQVFWVKPGQLLNTEGAQAEYSVLQANLGEGRIGNAANLSPNDLVTWESFQNKAGIVPVRISTDLLGSDEAAIAHLAHESYELNGLYNSLEIQGNQMTYGDLNRLVRPVASETGVPLGGVANNLHESAWTYADQVILKWRGH